MGAKKVFQNNIGKQVKLLLVIFASMNCVLYAQETKQLPFLRISDIFVQTEFGRVNSTNLNLDRVREILPNSTILSKDFSAFGPAVNYQTNAVMSNSIALGLQFRTKDKAKFSNRFLRIGIGSVQQDFVSFGLNRQQRITYDTLVSASTGAKVYKDSIIDERLFFNYSSRNIRFSTSMIFRTQEKRWTFYAGFGVNTTFSYNATTRLRFDRSKYESSEYATNNEQNGSSSAEENEKGMRNFAVQMFVPLGVNFNIGKKRAFWQHVHLYYEINPALSYREISGFAGQLDVNAPNVFGLRYSIK
jgi:hypothetical protein